MALTKIDDRGLTTPIDLLDDERIRIGAGNDLQLYHSSGNSFIDIGAGQTGYIRTSQLQILGAGGGETLAVFNDDGNCSLYNDNVKRIETSGTGSTITGTLILDKNSGGDSSGVSGEKLILKTQSGNLAEIDCISEGGGGANGHGGAMRFYTKENNVAAAAERLLIDSNGNLRIPFKDSSNGLRQKIKWVTESPHFDEVAYLSIDRTATSSAPSDMVFATGPVGSVAERLRIESDGDFRLSGDNAATNYGWIRGWTDATGDMIIGADQSATGTSGSNIIFRTRGGERLRIINGGGITFNGDTAAANALDDYEEGQWTPAVHFGGSNSGVNYGSNNGGSYTKIGRFVHVHGRVEITSKGSETGSATIRGLPFTCAGAQSGASSVEGGVFFTYQHNWMSNLDYYNPLGYLLENTTIVSMTYRDNSGDTQDITDSNLEDYTSIAFEAFYPV